MADNTLIVSVVGIAVSGVVGPSATAFAARRAQRQQFVRDREGKRRDELLSLLDEAASVLGLGVTRIRQMSEATEAGAPTRAAYGDWAEQVFALEQRLRLRLGAAHDLVTAYARVREALVKVAQRGGDQDEAVSVAFERARGEFLDVAQRALSAPVPDKEPNT